MKGCGGCRVGGFAPRICNVILCFCSFLPVFRVHLCLLPNLQQLFFSFLQAKKKGTMHKWEFKRYPDIFQLAK